MQVVTHTTQPANQSRHERGVSKSHPSSLYFVIAVLAIVAGVEARSLAQVPAPPTGAPPATPVAQPQPQPTAMAAPTDQAQADKEWLTSYFMVHEGYRLQHMPAIEATLNKMTPTQLHTLRDMYDQKRSMMMQQQATFNQWNAQQVAHAQAYDQQQTRRLNQISAEESQSASVEERQINQMHEEAAANAEAKNLSYPGMYGPYGGAGYGGYGGGYRGYFNPLGP